MITNLPAILRGRAIKENVDMDETISKMAALVAVKDALMAWSYMPEWRDEKILEAIAELPSAEPDIIRCRNCKFASGDSRICMKFGHSPIGELDFCAWAERRTDG